MLAFGGGFLVAIVIVLAGLVFLGLISKAEAEDEDESGFDREVP